MYLTVLVSAICELLHNAAALLEPKLCADFKYYEQTDSSAHKMTGPETVYLLFFCAFVQHVGYFVPNADTDCNKYETVIIILLYSIPSEKISFTYS